MHGTPTLGLLRGSLYFLGGLVVILGITALAAVINVEMLPYFFYPATVYLFYLGYQHARASFTLAALRSASFIIFIGQFVSIYFNYTFFFWVYLKILQGANVTYWNLLTYRIPSYMADNDGGILTYFIAIIMISLILYIVSFNSMKSVWMKQIKED